jgi:hypothetical protein
VPLHTAIVAAAETQPTDTCCGDWLVARECPINTLKVGFNSHPQYARDAFNLFKELQVSLIDDLKAIEPGYNGMNPYVIEDELELEPVEDTYLDSGRWVEYHRAVFNRGDEYVALDYEVPATEMQEGGDFDWSFYSVKPVTKTVVVTTYEKV